MLSAPIASRLRRVAGATFALASLSILLSTGASAQNMPQGNAPGTAPMKSRDYDTTLPGAIAPVYNDKYEVFGGLNLMNGQAGQSLPKRYNMGGGEVMATYWLGHGIVRNFGVSADYRIGLGTTPVISPYYNRVLIYQNIASGGIEYRSIRNRYAAIDFHALAGISHGTFDSAVKNYPSPGSPVSACAAQQTSTQAGNLGLYCNGNTPWGAAGGSIDFNYSPRVGIRLSPDITFEHFGTETREFFALSGGVMYRFGTR